MTHEANNRGSKRVSSHPPFYDSFHEYRDIQPSISPGRIATPEGERSEAAVATNPEGFSAVPFSSSVHLLWCHCGKSARCCDLPIVENSPWLTA